MRKEGPQAGMFYIPGRKVVKENGVRLEGHPEVSPTLWEKGWDYGSGTVSCACV